MVDTKILAITFLVAGALVGGASAYVGMGFDDMSKQKAGEMVAETLSDQTGNTYEVVKVEETNGLYEVQVSSNNQLQTYYVTKDGKRFSGQMANLTQVRQTVAMQNEVATCLENKNAVLYGNITQQPTVAQIQVLGGAQKVSGYYKDVNNPTNLQEAANRGISSVPALWMGNRTLSNVNNLERISKFAGCQ